MRALALRRVALGIPQIVIVAVGIFALLRVLPVDPVTRIVGQFATADARRLAEQQLGLSTSFGGQLAHFLRGLPALDFGRSWSTGDSVRSDIATRLPVTLQLVILGFIVALSFAIPLGLYSARKPHRRISKIIGGYGMFAGAQPDFWWGLLFIYLFSVKLGWTPAPLGVLDPGTVAPAGPTKFVLLDTLIHGQFSTFASALEHFLLPVMTLAFVQMGAILKIMRTSAIEVERAEYVLYGRVSGASHRTLRRMTLRNALAPVATVTGLFFSYALGGAVVIETVFSLDGLGRYALQSTLNTDFPAIEGAVVTLSAISLAIYLGLDLLYAVLDPRVRIVRA